MAIHKCVSACGRTFPTEHGLRVHQGTCRTFRYNDPALSELSQKLAAKEAQR